MFRAALVRAAMVAALASAACSSPTKSFVVLDLKSDAVGTSIVGVDEIVVTVSQLPSFEKILTYPAHDLTLTSDQTPKNDLSVSFSGAQSGSVQLAVEARDAQGCTIGRGTTTATLRKGSVATATVMLSPDSDCSVPDGGRPVGDASFPGCDPVTPACDGGQTCQVNCTSKKGECTKGGKGAPGAVCLKNEDCMPGTQCFDYAGPASAPTGCNVKLCLRFCNSGAQCDAIAVADGGVAASDGGVGTRSVCEGPVQCGSLVTAYRTCTFGCDPRQSAVEAKASGCPTGLSCLLVANMDQVDCACAEKTRVGTDGVDCTSGSQCAPGFICNMMGGSQKCRAVCRCDASGMACTAPNDCTAGKGCTALTNDTLFGVCL